MSLSNEGVRKVIKGLVDSEQIDHYKERRPPCPFICAMVWMGVGLSLGIFWRELFTWIGTHLF
jgi:hypothetical protein